MKKLLVVAFVGLLARFAYAADLPKVHEAGFGPVIRDLQLGKSMTWPEMLDRQSKIISTPKPWVPGTPPPTPVPAMYGVIVADNYKAVDQQSDSANTPGKWIVMNFVGTNQLTIMNSGGGIISKVPKSGTLDDLFKILKENGLNYISGPNITLCGERVIRYSVDKKFWPAAAAKTGDFAKWLSKTYSLGALKQKGGNYEADNLSEGWRVVVTDDKVTLFSLPMGKMLKKP